MLEIENVKEITGKKEFTLVTREDEVTGEIGWCLEQLAYIQDMPSVAIDPYLIAHDIIEHVNGVEEIGGVGEELQAMGGVWNTRGQNSDLRRNNPYSSDPYEGIASDIAEMGRRLYHGEELGTEIPDYVECGYEEDMDDIWNIAKESLVSELEYEDIYEEVVDMDKIDEYEKAYRSLFSYGIRKHQKLFDKRGYTANRLFYDIVEELDDKLETTDENEEILISLDYDNYEANVSLKEYDYDYDY